MLLWMLIPLGFATILYADKIFDFIGEIDFAEKILPAGGTVSFIKLVGLAVIVLSFMWLVGGFGDLEPPSII